MSNSLQPPDCTCQAPLSMEVTKQEYWNGLPFPSPGDFPNPGIELGSPALQADSLPSLAQRKPHSFTHFPSIYDNSNFQLLRPKCLESSLTLFSPHTTFDSAANATGSIFKIYLTLTLSDNLHICSTITSCPNYLLGLP